MKTIKGKKVGRKKKPVYKSIFGDYDDTDLDKKIITIPKIINQDIGWELQSGMKRTTVAYENQYLESKFTR